MNMFSPKRIFFTFLLVGTTAFLTASLAGISSFADNFTPKNAKDKPAETKQWADEMRQKMDKAIAIMEVIREDIDDIEKSGVMKEEPQVPRPWGENVKSNIDKMTKFLEVIKEDVSELEKIDESKADLKAERDLKQ